MMPRYMIMGSGVVRDGCAFIPADKGNADWREYQQWLLGGGVLDVPPPEQVTEIHIAWLEQALLEIGKLDAVNAAVASDPVKASLWKRVTDVSLYDPDVKAIGGALGIDLFALFERADAIRQSRVLQIT